MKKILMFLLLTPFFSSGQSVNGDSTWNPVKFFIGEWTGRGEGEPGKGNYERSYKFILKNNFIEIKNTAAYLPTNKKEKGEIHEDLGYISYDKIKKKFILRQFHVEGFVNEYLSADLSSDGKTIIFITESIENIPPGYRGRETYRILTANEFEEIFEIAEPGKDFTVYSRVQFTRKP
jgi:hypothetical protein